MAHLHTQRRRSFGLLAALSLALFSLAAVSGCGNDKDDDGGPGGKGGASADVLKYVPADAVMGAVLRPKQLLTKKELENFPVEVASAAGIEHLGVDPVHIETMVMFVGDLGLAVKGTGPPAIGVVAILNEPTQVDALLPFLREQTKKTELNGRTYYQAQSAMEFGIYMPDDRTVLIAPDAVIHSMLEADGGGALNERLAAVDATCDYAFVVDVAAVRAQVPFEEARRDAPPELQGLVSAVEKMSAGEFTLTVGESLHVAAVFHAEDEAGAEFIAAQINKALEMARTASQMWIGTSPISDDPDYAAAMKLYLDRVTSVVVDALAPKQDGTKVTVTVNVPIEFGVLGMGAALYATARADVERQSAMREATLEMQRIEGEIEKFDAPPNGFPTPPDQPPPSLPPGDAEPDRTPQPDPEPSESAPQ